MSPVTPTTTPPSEAPARLSTLLLVGITTAAATFTILVVGGSGSIEILPVRVAYDVMAAVALIIWLVVAAVRPSWRPASVLLPAIAAILLAFTISAITSTLPRISIEMLGYAILLVLLYLLLVATGAAPRRSASTWAVSP